MKKDLSIILGALLMGSCMDMELLPNDKTAKSNGITWQDIELALDYGMRNGLGQFRNGGYGRFTWQEVRDEQ